MPLVPEPPTQVGSALPAHTPHAVSVMFPTWQDNIDYEEGNPAVTSKMESGYPRFFIHPCIQKLCARIVAKFGKPDDAGMLFPSRKVAEGCREFMAHIHPESRGAVRVVELKIGSDDGPLSVYGTLFPQDAFKAAKQYWQHTGCILSSRMAEHCLNLLDASKAASPAPEPPTTTGKRSRYSKAKTQTSKHTAETEDDHAAYVEERYGRNLPIEFVDHAKVALRRRIAGIMAEHDANAKVQDFAKATSSELESQRLMRGTRGMKGLSEEDVYLYPCGMSAIYYAHQAALAILDASRKSVCFGFPYTDTLKILQKFGPGCHFYGLGEDKDIDDLESKLKAGEHILALFCEVPSNPLLKTPNLKRLRGLADEYGFLIVVDETIGNFCNVSVLPFADMVVSSLTKIFSGDCNVMGGSMVLNPNRKHYGAIKQYLNAEYEDMVWCEDALFLERNSRNFQARSQTINENAEALCDFLSTHPKMHRLYYPKFVCREYYDAVRNADGGYGGLFSMVLENEQAARTFYDHLHSAKGPSLGTNFTLVSPYTLLAHYSELDWAAEYGVSSYLIRVSVGLEDKERLLKSFKDALDAIGQ